MNSSSLIASAKRTLTIPLLDLMGGPEGWGQVQGSQVAAQVRSCIEACPSLIVRLSLRGVEKMDASFAGVLVRLAAHERRQRGFCLVDITDRDLLTNWWAAAICHGQPLFVWNDGILFRRLGPSSSAGLREMLEYVLGVPVARTSEAAATLNLKVPNASNKLKQLWIEGFILRREQSAESGGVEYEYLRIA